MAERSKYEHYRSLLEHPQPLGVLPTWWFWTDRASLRLLGPGFGALAVLTLVALGLLSMHSLVGGIIAGVGIVLTSGMLEKRAREQAIERSLLVEWRSASLPSAALEDED